MNTHFKDLNVVYNEERNRDEGYWSSSSDDDESDGERPAKQQKLRSKNITGSSPKKNVDYATEMKERARQEWLWATGQLGKEEELPSRAKGVQPAAKEQKKLLLVPSEGDSVTGAKAPVSAASDSEQQKGIQIPVVQSSPITPQPAASTQPSQPSEATAGVVSSEALPAVTEASAHNNNAHVQSLESLEAQEYEAAQTAWIATNFEKPFVAEYELKEAKRRAAARFYQQQNQPYTSNPHTNDVGTGAFEMPSVGTVAAALPASTYLTHYHNQQDEWERRGEKVEQFSMCVDELEKLVRSDAFVNRVQRFLHKHHRSLLSTRVMRESGEYCHEDHAVFRAYVTEMEGCILKAIHDGASRAKMEQLQRRRVLNKEASSSRRGLHMSDGRSAAGIDRVVGGVSVVVNLEENDDGEDYGDRNDDSYHPLTMDADFDEEEFFDYLFSGGDRTTENSNGVDDDDADTDDANGGDVLSFEAWEALLSVLNFNSFIDLVDEYVAAEYGIDDMETRVDSKAARKKGLPITSHTPTGGTPPAAPLVVGSSGSPTRSGPPTAAASTTPSPPRGGVAVVGSGAAMRRLVPSSTASTRNAFVSSSSTKSTGANGGGTSSAPTSASGGPRPVASQLSQTSLSKSMTGSSTAGVANRAPGSAPKPGTTGSRSSSQVKK